MFFQSRLWNESAANYRTIIVQYTRRVALDNFSCDCFNTGWGQIMMPGLRASLQAPGLFDVLGGIWLTFRYEESTQKLYLRETMRTVWNSSGQSSQLYNYLLTISYSLCARFYQLLQKKVHCCLFSCHFLQIVRGHIEATKIPFRIIHLLISAPPLTPTTLTNMTSFLLSQALSTWLWGNRQIVRRLTHWTWLNQNQETRGEKQDHEPKYGTLNTKAWYIRHKH